MEFPDEVEVPIDVPARKRFMKYAFSFLPLTVQIPWLAEHAFFSLGPLREPPSGLRHPLQARELHLDDEVSV